ncbi:PREDICTED: alpha-S1-casein [Galeopterus variegatus]|uniref:Alpha-S1-casein n=1 Tax=Galeopterus variegatus TaxID=482537 RepID=A0ABM0S4E9_GALVR|nr:PREDICTED: alpha-S1-casein [Galeopterus variegatus]
MEDAERESTSSSSSEEFAVSSTEEQLRRLSKYNQLQMEQLPRMNEDNYVQMRAPMRVMNQEQAQLYLEPFQQFYQLDAYPYATWYYPPQIMQYAVFPPIYNIPMPIASESMEKTDVMPEW